MRKLDDLYNLYLKSIIKENYMFQLEGPDSLS